MDDRERLEMAAKAAGIVSDGLGGCYDDDREQEWNPLNDDGDALRLAVKLNMDVCRGLRGPEIGVAVLAMHGSMSVAEYLGDDPYAATRRAIVRAAAELGKAMP